MLQANQLQEHLRVLTQNPDSRLLLQSQKGWIVLHSFDISTRILCEIATNRHLEKEFHLSDEQIQIFEDKKYFKRREGTSRGRLLTINSNNNQDFCEELLFIASCYEPDANNWTVSFTPTCRHNLKNSKILMLNYIVIIHFIYYI